MASAACRDQGLTALGDIQATRVYLLEFASSATLDRNFLQTQVMSLLADQVVEDALISTPAAPPPEPPDALVLEVYYRPGVMDPVGKSAQAALERLGIAMRSVRTGRAFEIRPRPGPDVVERLCRVLGNDCIEQVVIGRRPIAPAPSPPANPFSIRQVPVRALDDEALGRLSRDRHLFLSLLEMRAIQSHFRTLDREPTDLELETLAQTWSEHCVHKTLRSPVDYEGAPFPLEAASAESTPGSKSWEHASDREEGNTEAYATAIRPVVRCYENLLKDTIVRATERLAREGRGPECLSVFRDNAGIIGFDPDYGVAFKVETHNHPSAIEPYGGAATGVGGVIRDVLGCGLGAKPVANTDVFCVAPPTWPVEAVPKGALHPKAVLKGVVTGVRDYGNCMGIPTVNGAVHFDPRYLGNPLVYCGCVGLIPRDRIAKGARAGDAIVLIGGRTGRDGIHGATFSSAELSDTHAEEFAHAVQIGNPIEEKKILDVILLARDYLSPGGGESTGDGGSNGSSAKHAGGPASGGTASQMRRVCLFSAITDCGAGGLSSAIGEMGEHTGADVELARVPLKYDGLRYDEIWISEAQERMVLAVPPQHVDAFLSLARDEEVEATVIGRFTDTGRLVVRFDGAVVGDLDMAFLHHGLPRPTRAAEWMPAAPVVSPTSGAAGAVPSQESECPDLRAALLARLSDPTVASKHWIIRQYDHEVQGRSVIKPLSGPGEGPSDAAVLRPRLDSNRGIALGCGLAPELYDLDPYWMAVAAIDEALRNVVCTGGDPARTAILDNFCWPRVDPPRNLGALVRACQGCHDAAVIYGLPFISGKDSLNNEFALEPSDVDRVRAAALRFGMGRAAGPGPAFRSADGRGEMVVDGRIAIPGTLLISALSLIDDVVSCATIDLKQSGSRVVLVGPPTTWNAPGTDGSGDGARPRLPGFDPRRAAEIHGRVARLIREGVVLAAHDVSDGGILVALAEMAIAGDRSVDVFGFASAMQEGREDWHTWVDDHAGLAFFLSRYPAMYLLEIPCRQGTQAWERFTEIMNDTTEGGLTPDSRPQETPRAPRIPWIPLGEVGEGGCAARPARLAFSAVVRGRPIDAEWSLAELRDAWRTPLDW